MATTVVVASTLLVLRRADQADALALIAQATQLCFALVLISSAILLLCRWYLLNQAASGWIAAAMIILAIYLRPELYLSTHPRPSELIVAPTDVACMLVLVWVTGCAAKERPPTGLRHPILVGVGFGLALTVLRSAWFTLDLDTYERLLALLVSLAFPVAAFICAQRILASRAFPDEYRWQLVLPLALGIGFYHFVPATIDPLGYVSVMVTTVCAATAITTLTASIALVQEAFATQSRRLAQLADRASQAETLVNDDAERLHECRSTLAGISSASQLLITEPQALAEEQTVRLRELLNSEMARLQTLLDPTITPDPAPLRESVALDEVVEPLVLSALARGVQVDYRPSSSAVLVQPEALVSAVLALVGNAERHAPGAHLSLWSTTNHDQVALHVSDDGPGIPDSLEETLFTRGERGEKSPGEGIGLYAARRGLRRTGGELRREESARGAQFVVILPKAA
ncbi:sensor histidine kinase [Nocardioides sp. Bht2]|uniref:sensor histidine kinase n=1 Tax=Nocardioides sp. Bht2 TaxID=3392297 RepID=UPI0039B46634